MDIKNKLKLYLDSYLKPVEEERGFFKKAKLGAALSCECCEASSISEYIDKNKDEDTFQTKLFKLIDERELKDSDVYNKVNIDRRLFSKIRSNVDYHPSKETIILLGLALELDENEIVDLLESASYSLPMNSTYDLIIRFCFKEHIYNISTVNDLLYEYKCRILGE